MNTLFDKIWDAHVVTTVEDGPTQLYIDRLYCHEVTSPQAFAGLRERGIGVLRPEKVFCMPDHNTPTHDQDKEIEDPISKTQVDTLTKNAKDFGLTHYGMMHPKNGIIHVVGPERGLTLHQPSGRLHLHQHTDGLAHSAEQDFRPHAGHVRGCGQRQLRRAHRAEDFPCGDCGGQRKGRRRDEGLQAHSRHHGLHGRAGQRLHEGEGAGELQPHQGRGEADCQGRAGAHRQR